MKTINTNRALKRKMRISLKVRGTAETPRISIYRSSKYIYVQAIDDVGRCTICAFSSKKLKKESKINKTEQAKQVGVALAALLKEKKIEKAVFDRGMFSYLGRVKMLAQGLRDGGIQI